MIWRNQLTSNSGIAAVQEYLITFLSAVAVVAVQKTTITMAASKPVFRNAEEGQKLVSATTKFALSLYQQLVSENEGNLFFSPASIAVGFGMTYLGARQNTASEMKEVLHFKDVTDEHLHPSFGDMLAALQSTNEYTASDLLDVLPVEDIDEEYRDDPYFEHLLKAVHSTGCEKCPAYCQSPLL